jgi:hypothetical protein
MAGGAHCAGVLGRLTGDRDRDRRCHGSGSPRGRCRDLAGGAARHEGGDMIAVPAGVRVLVATKPVDFRRGADSLARWYASSSSTIRFPGRSSSSARSVRIA